MRSSLPLPPSRVSPPPLPSIWSPPPRPSKNWLLSLPVITSSPGVPTQLLELQVKVRAQATPPTTSTVSVMVAANNMMRFISTRLPVWAGAAFSRALVKHPTAVRWPGYLPLGERSIGFAPPPRGGFAFLAAPRRQQHPTQAP